jgi:hypothetical protein
VAVFLLEFCIFFGVKAEEIASAQSSRISIFTMGKRSRKETEIMESGNVEGAIGKSTPWNDKAVDVGLVALFASSVGCPGQ